MTEDTNPSEHSDRRPDELPTAAGPEQVRGEQPVGPHGPVPAYDAANEDALAPSTPGPGYDPAAPHDATTPPRPAPAHDATAPQQPSRPDDAAGRYDPAAYPVGAVGAPAANPHEQPRWYGAPAMGHQPPGYDVGGQPYPTRGEPWVPPPGEPPAGPPPAAGPSGGGHGRRRFRSGLAVAAIAAVVGGLVGGGTVALVDRGTSGTGVAASVTRSSGTARGSDTSQSGTVTGAAATISPSAVTLNVGSNSASGTGSGVIVRADGYILTNDHVVSAAASGGTITVAFADGRTATAKIVGTDAETDLAVVKVDGVSGLTAATFADSDSLKVGQTVVAMGAPLGLDNTVTAGIISALHRPTTGGDNGSAIFDAVQTDAPINPGNSGGPLVDLSGRVVGINAEIATAGSNSRFPGQASGSGNIGIGFAIPSNTAADIADQLIAKGSAQHAFLGVQASSGSASTALGATLASVVSGGPADKAGLRAGDVITKIDGRPIADSEALVAAVRGQKIGTTVTVTYIRGGAQKTVTVTLGTDAKQ